MEELMTKLNELAPEAIEQMIGWGIFCNWLGVIICSLLILGYAGVVCLCLKKANDWDEDVVIPILLIGGVIALFTILFLVGMIADLCKIYYWPHAYIIDSLT